MKPIILGVLISVGFWAVVPKLLRVEATETIQPTSQPKTDNRKQCICSEYVSRVFPSYPEWQVYTEQMLREGVLAEAGFKRVSKPVKGAIVLYEPGVQLDTFNSGSSGHVEYVVGFSGYTPVVHSTFTLDSRYIFSDKGCDNIGQVKRQGLSASTQGVSYWIKGGK